MTTLSYWRAELGRHPILAGWLIIFAVHAGMNAKLGHEMGGAEGFGALLYASAFLGFAVLGAWAADQIGAARGLRQMGLALVAVLQLLIGQMAGWQAMGLTLNKGAASLEAKADSRKTTKDGLEAARAELAAIPTPRPIASIEAEAALECGITSRQYKDGVGPKCTRLRSELAAAQRAGVLKGEIARLTAELGAGPKVKDANALYQAPQGIAQGVVNAWAWMMGGTPAVVAPDDVRFGWMVFLVFALEFFGTFGLALIRQSSDGGDHDMGRPAAEPRPSAPPAWTPPGGGGGGQSFRDAIQAVAGGYRPGLPAPEPLMAIAGPAGSYMHAPETAWAPDGARLSAPINIHFAAPASPGPLSPSAVGAANMPELAGSSIRPAPVPKPRPRRDLPALPADAPPVDRSRIMRDLAPEEREAGDVILHFRAACLEDVPGSLVSAADLYRRYVAWVGERAVAEPAFARLLSDVTGLAPAAIAGAPHYQGVALKMGVKLEAVA